MLSGKQRSTDTGGASPSLDDERVRADCLAFRTAPRLRMQIAGVRLAVLSDMAGEVGLTSRGLACPRAIGRDAPAMSANPTSQSWRGRSAAVSYRRQNSLQRGMQRLLGATMPFSFHIPYGHARNQPCRVRNPVNPPHIRLGRRHDLPGRAMRASPRRSEHRACALSRVPPDSVDEWFRDHAPWRRRYASPDHEDHPPAPQQASSPRQSPRRQTKPSSFGIPSQPSASISATGGRLANQLR